MTVSDVVDRAGEGGQEADPLWGDWETPSQVPSSPELHLEGFDGPLDLLLDLVERKRIDLRRMSPRAMVEQLADPMERYAAQVPLERRADWLVMAARLVLLRSRLCFPRAPKRSERPSEKCETQTGSWTRGGLCVRPWLGSMRGRSSAVTSSRVRSG